MNTTQDTKHSRNFNWKYAIVISLPIQILFFYTITQNQVWVEKIYIPYIFKNLTTFLRLVLGKINFSIGIMFFYIILAITLFKLFKILSQLIRKKQSLRHFLLALTANSLAILAIFYALYMLMWGLAYHRKPIVEIVNINTSNISSKDLENLCERLIYLTNESRKRVPDIRTRSYKFQELFQKAPAGYTHVSKNIPELSYQYPSIKLGPTKDIFSYLSISGIYFPFTGEANISGNLPSFEAPFVICHEMAHQLGFAAEEEASYIAYITCLHNSDPAFQYSANYFILYSAMNTLRQVNKETYEILSSKINKEVVQDRKFSRNIWLKYSNPMNFVSGILYDFFLKANSQESGINSYDLVVALMIGELKKNDLKYE